MTDRVLPYDGLTEQQQFLADVASSVLTADPANPMAGADLGWFGIGVDGSSGSIEDLSVVLEVAGATTSSSLVGCQAGVVAPLFVAGGPAAERLVGRITSGAAVVAVPTDTPSRICRSSLTMSNRRLRGSYLAVGPVGVTHTLVPFPGPDGLHGAAALPADAAGVGLVAIDPVDLTRPLLRVTLDDVRLDEADAVVTAPRLFDTWLARVNLVTALDASGVARRALERTLDYSRERYQFGRAIGSFQAYKHRCATMFVKLKLGQSLAFAAARDFDGPDGTALALSAGLLGTAHAAFIAGEAVQLHGGIGFTWEAGLHTLLKRARADEIMARAGGCGPQALIAAFRARRRGSQAG